MDQQAMQAAADAVAAKLEEFYRSLPEDERHALAQMLRYGAAEVLPGGGRDADDGTTLVIKGSPNPRDFHAGYLTDPSTPIVPNSQLAEPLFTTEIRLRGT